MKKIFVLLFVLSLFNDSNSFAKSKVKAKAKVSKNGTSTFIEFIYKKFNEGDYQQVLLDLDKIEIDIKKHKKHKKDIQGLVYYWKAVTYAKINEYEQSLAFFKNSIEENYIPKDLYYEYAQALYVSEKLKGARLAFKKSVKKKFKRGVSLYYIAYISQQLKDNKKAVKFYTMIEKLPEEEKKDVVQAARMQIGDIYLMQVEKMPNTFKSVRDYIIPQYRKAIEFDKQSTLAEEIRTKIRTLQRRYELLLFKMRNGRPTAIPPYFLKANILYGNNSNPRALSDDDQTGLADDEVTSAYTSMGFFGRYSFYPNSSFSMAPEVNISSTTYHSTADDIKLLNSYSITTSLKMNHEHLHNKLASTTYIDFGYTYNADASVDPDTIEKLNSTYTVTVSEERQFWKDNPTTLRYKYTSLTAEDETTSSTANSFVWEQLVSIYNQTLFSYMSYDATVYPDTDTLDTNAFTWRVDYILPTAWGLFNPSFYYSMTNTDYINDDSKGTLALKTIGLSANRPISKRWYVTADYSLDTQTADTDSDNYTATKWSFNLDYIY